MHLKRQGQYICRTLSYHGCTFRVDEEAVGEEALRTYDEAARYWIQLHQQLQENIKNGDLKYFDRRAVPGSSGTGTGNNSNKSTPPKRGKHSARNTNSAAGASKPNSKTSTARKTRRARYGPPTSDDTGSDSDSSASSLHSSVLGSDSSGDSADNSGDSEGNKDAGSSDEEEYVSGSLVVPASDAAAIRSINRYFWGKVILCCRCSYYLR